MVAPQNAPILLFPCGESLDETYNDTLDER